MKSKLNLSQICKWLAIICFVLAIGCLGYEPAKSYLVNHYKLKSRGSQS